MQSRMGDGKRWHGMLRVELGACPVPWIPGLRLVAARAPACISRLSPMPQVQGRQVEGRQTAAVPEIIHTLLEPERFTRALAITTTICCAG